MNDIDASEAFIADLKRREFNDKVNEECELYLETRDGRFLWRAFLLLHEAKEPIPQNMLDKLAQWGERVLAAESPTAITVALELGGSQKKRVGPKHSAAYRKDRDIAMQVAQSRNFHQIKLLKDAIALIASRRGLSYAKVQKAYHAVFTAPLKKLRAPARSLDAALRGWR